jgi:hypothetical protein
MHTLHEFAQRDYRNRWIARLDMASKAGLALSLAIAAVVALRQIALVIG